MPSKRSQESRAEKSSRPSTNTDQKNQLLKELNNARTHYRAAVRWFRDTLSYKNLAEEAWESGRHEELKADAQKALKESVADIFRWRKKIDVTTKKLMNLAEKNRRENDSR